MLNRIFIALIAILACGVWALGCEEGVDLTETGDPEGGTIIVRIESAFGTGEQEAGIDLPDGIRVWVRTAEGNAPDPNAQVTLYPGGTSPRPMVYKTNGRYEIDVLSEWLTTIETDYFVEIVSETLIPERNVVRVPHDSLTVRPTIIEPTERSEHTIGEELIVSWEAVSNADCYTLSTREHTLEEWTAIHQCITETTATLNAEQASTASFIRIRASKEMGDVENPDERFRYLSSSTSDAEVRIFLVEPTG